MKPINVDKLFNRKAIINEFEYSLNVNNQIKTWVVAKKSPDEYSTNNERMKGVGIASGNQDDDHLEELVVTENDKK